MICARPDSYQILQKNKNEAGGQMAEAAEQSWRRDKELSTAKVGSESMSMNKPSTFFQKKVHFKPFQRMSLCV